MRLWRVSTHERLDGGGGLRSDGRWHSAGYAVVYAATSPATALLEIVLGVGRERLLSDYKLLLLEVPPQVEMAEVRPGDLPPGWKSHPDVTRAVGDRWLAEGRTALLRVPSSIVPENNVVINPRHPDAARISLVGVEDIDFDQPLF